MTNCINCNNPISEKFCPNCGQPAKLKRIDKHYISHELLHLFHFEKGFSYTVKGLLTKPGESIREFIDENRNRHIKPVAFLILTALILVIVSHLTHADKVQNDQSALVFGKSKAGDIYRWMLANHGYGNLISGVCAAFSVALFYRKFKYNLFEILILMCFVIGQGTLLLAFTTLFFGLMKTQWYQMSTSIVSMGYSTWAIQQFFGGTKIGSYVKAFFALVFGQIIFAGGILIIGLIADLIIKML